MNNIYLGNKIHFILDSRFTSKGKWETTLKYKVQRSKDLLNWEYFDSAVSIDDSKQTRSIGDAWLVLLNSLEDIKDSDWKEGTGDTFNSIQNT
jgi:hypothetical protein